MQTTPAVDQPLSHFYLGSKISDLNQVSHSDCNLAIWQRNPSSAQVAAKELLNTDFQGLQFVYDRSEPIEVIGSFLDETTNLNTEVAIALWTDIMMLTEKMLQLCDDPELGISIERVTHNNCTSFHTDYVNLRLLCTYWGEASYWLENSNVNRNNLGKNNNNLVVKDWDKVHQMQTHWVGIFKGENSPGNNACGIVHRSPEILGKEKADRLLLRIDTMKSFGKEYAE